jgi:hypothetical protein
LRKLIGIHAPDLAEFSRLLADHNLGNVHAEQRSGEADRWPAAA